MKFSQALHFNAVPNWLEGYVAYDGLKKLIFQLERDRVNAVNNTRNDSELAPSTIQDIRTTFTQAVHQELEKVLTFYYQKEDELKRLLQDMEETLDSCPQDPYPDMSPVLPSANTSTHDLSEIDEKKLTAPKAMGNVSRLSVESRVSFHSHRDHQTDMYLEHLVDLRQQIISLYISFCELQSYVELNRTAFNKILKKYDKVLEDNIRQEFINDHVKTCHPFTTQAMHLLQSRINRLEKIYADMFARGQVHLAIQQMRVHLRDQLTYERNTVWKDMVNQELRMRDAHIKEAAPVKCYRIPFSRHTVPASQVHSLGALLASLTVFIILLNVNIFGATHENHCFALLVFASMLWATEAIPLYATSLLIPFLVVPLGILQTEDGRPLSAASASKAVFSSMFNSTIMMLLGGFAIAGALSKYGIAKAFASRVLAHAGTRPRWVLLAVMFVSAFLSMWISNVATPVLCFSLIDPILRTLDDNSPVAPCLLLGIALASCIGGLTSPISSPQNIITLQYMNPSPGWGVWFAVALPIAILSLLAAWSLLLFVYRPGRACVHLNTIKPTRGNVSSCQVFVLLITIITIVLWCLESTIEDYIGSTGIIAAIPLFMFFGTRILGKEDLHAFLWSVVVLAQGGMALGYAVTSSGLLQDIAVHIKTGIEGLHAFSILCIFSILLLVFSTFVSHTVAALILIPIVQQVGQHLPQPHPNLLVMGAGLACSAGMGLTVSGFPNMSAAMLEDHRGKQYLTTKDFIVTGIPTSIICTVLIFTLGYGIMTLMGF